MIYFGTDGIRGVVGEDITHEVAFKCGNALGSLKKHAKIIVGTDTRVTADFLFCSLASGAVMAGADIYFVGIAPTPAISFLVQKHHADFGVMLTASHNPASHNGIKVFDCNGEKVDIKVQTEIERGFAHQKVVEALQIGKIIKKPKFLDEYISFIAKNSKKIENLKVVIDCSNGAGSVVAGKVFKKLGANLIKINSTKNGKNINKNCGALYPQKLASIVQKVGADVGFAFDGDADRIVMVDNNGKICDGDQIILFLTDMFKKHNMLSTGAVVGTSQSNMAMEKRLEKCNLKLIRADVGDQFVTQELKKRHLQIGGEQSGHIILYDYEKTGDGIFCATQICKFLSHEKDIDSNAKISSFLFYDMFEQYCLNIATEKKFEIINSAKFRVEVSECENWLKDRGRIVCRASGTENKLRIMVECNDEFLAQNILHRLENVAKEL